MSISSSRCLSSLPRPSRTTMRHLPSLLNSQQERLSLGSEITSLRSKCRCLHSLRRTSSMSISNSTLSFSSAKALNRWQMPSSSKKMRRLLSTKRPSLSLRSICNRVNSQRVRLGMMKVFKLKERRWQVWLC